MKKRQPNGKIMGLHVIRGRREGLIDRYRESYMRERGRKRERMRERKLERKDDLPKLNNFWRPHQSFTQKHKFSNSHTHTKLHIEYISTHNTHKCKTDTLKN